MVAYLPDSEEATEKYPNSRSVTCIMLNAMLVIGTQTELFTKSHSQNIFFSLFSEAWMLVGDVLERQIAVRRNGHRRK